MIGNGKNVRIKEDKWLLVNNNHTIISTLASIPVETKVQVLTNLELGVWKPDLIH